MIVLYVALGVVAGLLLWRALPYLMVLPMALASALGRVSRGWWLFIGFWVITIIWRVYS